VTAPHVASFLTSQTYCTRNPMHNSPSVCSVPIITRWDVIYLLVRPISPHHRLCLLRISRSSGNRCSDLCTPLQLYTMLNAHPVVISRGQKVSARARYIDGAGEESRCHCDRTNDAHCVQRTSHVSSCGVRTESSKDLETSPQSMGVFIKTIKAFKV
jgi:hypothetical protein